MSKIIRRLFDLDLPPKRSAFLWGPRKMGKSYWITHHLPEATLLDFLKTDVFSEYAARPSLLRERYQNHRGLIVLVDMLDLERVMVSGLLPPHFLSPNPLASIYRPTLEWRFLLMVALFFGLW